MVCPQCQPFHKWLRPPTVELLKHGLGHQLLLDTNKNKDEKDQFLYANFATCPFYCTGELKAVHESRTVACDCAKVDHHVNKTTVCRILNCTICKKIAEQVEDAEVSKKRKRRQADDIDDEEEVSPQWLTGVPENDDEEAPEVGYIFFTWNLKQEVKEVREVKEVMGVKEVKEVNRLYQYKCKCKYCKYECSSKVIG